MDSLTFFSLFVATALRMATPIALGAIGATFNERAGVLNIGIEGMMLTGAFTGAATSYYTGNPWLGIIAGIFGGALLGAFLGLLCVYINGDQVVVSVGINILAFGMTNLFLFLIWGNRGTSEWLTKLPKVDIPGLSQVPILGPALNGFDPIVYITWVIVVVSYIVMFRTPIGLWLRAAGEHPMAVETAGLDVYRIRFFATMISGGLAGLGGVELSLGALNIFTQGMTAGRGFLSFAANQFGHWHPVGAFAASLLFGLMEALQMRLQGSGVAPQLLQMLPYIVTLFVLATAVRRARAPASLGLPYSRGLGIATRKKNRKS